MRLRIGVGEAWVCLRRGIRETRDRGGRAVGGAPAAETLKVPHCRSVASQSPMGWLVLGLQGHDTWEPVDQLQGTHVKGLVNAFNEKLRVATPQSNAAAPSVGKPASAGSKRPAAAAPATVQPQKSGKARKS